MNIVLMTIFVAWIFCVSLFISMLIMEHHHVFHSGMPVDAVVCGKTQKWGKVYLTWSYSCNGTDYTYHAKRGRRKEKREIGFRGALLVKKRDNSRVYELRDPDSKAFLFILAVLTAAGVVIAVTTYIYIHGMIKYLVIL